MPARSYRQLRLARLKAIAASGVLALAAGLSVSMPAHATGTISCVSEEGASVDLGIGSLPILSIFSVYIQVDGRSLSTENDEIGAVQAFGDEEAIRVDFTDANVNEIVARLRLFRALEDNTFAMAGTLQIIDQGAYAVTCIGP